MADERCIHVGDVQVNGNRVVLPHGSRVVASYNWNTTSTAGRPHIITPGAPRVYVSPSTGRGRYSRIVSASAATGKYIAPGRRGLARTKQYRGFTLAKDNEVTVVDENKDRMHPYSSVDPLFHALDICSPDFDMKTVDIVTDRNNLRKLLRFCDSPGSRDVKIGNDDFRNEPFKFFCHPIGQDREGGKTLVFTRSTTGLEKEWAGYCKKFENKLTSTDPASPPDTGRFSVITKTSLDGLSLLVRSKVDARQTPVPAGTHVTEQPANLEDNRSAQPEETTASVTGESQSKVSALPSTEQDLVLFGPESFAKNSRLVSSKVGELLGDEPQLLELKTKNNRYSHTINWKDFYWQMALGCAHKLVLGLHNRGAYGMLEQLSLEEVKARAEKAGSSSMVYLVNTLREVIKAAHCLLAEHASSPTTKDDEGVSAAVVVEHNPSAMKSKAILRVRLAVPSDGAVAPSF